MISGGQLLGFTLASLAGAFAVAGEARGGWRAFRDGIVVGVTNPKSVRGSRYYGSPPVSSRSSMARRPASVGAVASTSLPW